MGKNMIVLRKPNMMHDGNVGGKKPDRKKDRVRHGSSSKVMLDRCQVGNRAVADVWMNVCWRPYWDELDGSKRSAYLDRGHLDGEWQEWLKLIDDPQPKKESGG
jgi:hypothetical protein